MAAKTENTEAVEVKGKSVTLAANVDPHLASFIEAVRWEMRLRKSDVVTKALREWADNNGYDPAADYSA